jgi:plasmid stability protein
MERISFEIERQDVVDALQAEAIAHGRSVAAEVAALVEQTYVNKSKRANALGKGNWVRELVELAKELDLKDGLDGLIPLRTVENYVPPKL